MNSRHTANAWRAHRRSLQATFIPRSGRRATNFVERTTAETRARLSLGARELLGIEADVAVIPDPNA